MVRSIYSISKHIQGWHGVSRQAGGARCFGCKRVFFQMSIDVDFHIVTALREAIGEAFNTDIVVADAAYPARQITDHETLERAVALMRELRERGFTVVPISKS